jgi:sugar phosphate isomerase/epimerase
MNHPPISFHSALTGGPASTWPETARVASLSGFPATDLVLPQIAAHAVSDVAQILAARELVVGGVPLPLEFRRDEDTYRRDLNALPELAHRAAELGARVFHKALPASSDLPKAELLSVLRRRISECARVLDAHGLQLALEVYGPLHLRREARYVFIVSFPEAAVFAQSCGENVGVLLDAWHWHHSGGTREDIVDFGRLVQHVHVADAPDRPPEEIRDDERLLPGEGVVDFRGFFSALSVVDYAGVVTPEIFGYNRAGVTPVACAREARLAVERAMV